MPIRRFLPVVLCLLAAAAGAAEQRIVERFRSAIQVMRTTPGPRTPDPLGAGVAVLVADGPLDEEAERGLLRTQFEGAFRRMGAPIDIELLSVREMTSQAWLAYATLRCERGVLYLRIATARDPARDEVLSFLATSPDPAAILPYPLLVVPR